MKTIITSLLLIASLLSANAASVANLNYLTEVNAEWKTQPNAKTIAGNANIAQNKTFTDWIATHLMLVEQTLRKKDVANLTDSQKQNREFLLNRLNNYWHLRQFPINDYLSYKNPVFIDRKGTHCAVGYLMQQSGSEHLARRIDATQKFAYIKDIKAKGVAEWASTNGFTIDELAWIQPGYMVSSTAEDLLGGVNGNVNTVLVDNGTIYAAGSFSQSTSGASVSNIGVYLSGFAGWLWTDLGGGLNGTVNTMVKHNNKLYVGGSFTMANGMAANHVAAYNLNTGQWENIGGLDGTVNTLCVYNNDIYAGGIFTNFVSKWNGTTWGNMPSPGIYGLGVRTIKAINNELYIGGDFELPTGALRRNVILYDGTQFINSGFGTPTPVNDFELHNGKVYAACDVILGNDTCALSVLENGDWQTIIKPNLFLGSSFGGTSINTLKSIGTKLYCGGNFGTMSGMFYGSNLMWFEPTNGGTIHDFTTVPVLYTDSTITSLANFGSQLYFGGKFVTNNYNDTLNHIGFIDILTTNITDNKTANSIINISPNPANNYLKISIANNNINAVTIVDVNGNEVFSTTNTNTTLTIDLQNFATGVYTIKANRENGFATKRFVKL